MKFVVVTVFMAFVLAVGGDSASVLSVTDETVIINGTTDTHANVQLHVPIEEIWAGLAEVHRYPTINSGDTIALRSAYTSGIYSTYWLHCNEYYCNLLPCEGSIMTSSRWSSCSPSMIFIITAMGKMEGEAINSGDTVSIISTRDGSSYRLNCGSVSTSMCSMSSVTSLNTLSITGSDWLLTYSHATFEIYAKNADYGFPVQYGDVVGFKFPYAGNSAWLTAKLTFSEYFFNPLSCSSSSKSPCAAENTWTGFKIFKKLS